MTHRLSYADDLLASREWQYRTTMAVVVRQIEGGNSELKLYGSLFARAMMRAYPDQLQGFEAELKRVGVSTWQRKRTKRVRIQRDDDGEPG